MSNELAGKTVAFLTANEGVEQVELTAPWQAVVEAGATPVLVSPKLGPVQGMHHLDRADTFTATVAAADAGADDYDALVLPGGVSNPDQLRMDAPAVAFVTGMAAAGKPIAVICHGPWTLVEAGLVRGRTLTSWPSLHTDIVNAGGRWVDEEVVVCNDGPATLVSSRKPDDLPAFTRRMVEAFAG